MCGVPYTFPEQPCAPSFVPFVPSFAPFVHVLQLVELAHLILGIRVFNFDIGKGGAGIVDIASLAHDSVTDLQRKLQVQPCAHACCVFLLSLVVVGCCIESPVSFGVVGWLFCVFGVFFFFFVLDKHGPFAPPLVPSSPPIVLAFSASMRAPVPPPPPFLCTPDPRPKSAT